MLQNIENCIYMIFTYITLKNYLCKSYTGKELWAMVT